MSYGVNAPWGLRPMQKRGASAFDEATQYSISSGSPYSFYAGDLVAVAPLGTTLANVLPGDLIPLSAVSLTVPATVAAFTTNGGTPASFIAVGVFMGCAYSVPSSVNPTNLYQMNPVWVGGTVTYGAQPAVAYVIDDPDVIFNVQCGGNANAVTQSLAPSGAVATFAQGTPTLSPGQSGQYLDMTVAPVGMAIPWSNGANSAAFPLKIIGPVQVPGNVYGIPYLNLKVSLNTSGYKAGQVGV